VLGARVLREFGDEPSRDSTAKSRKNYAGPSPPRGAASASRGSPPETRSVRTPGRHRLHTPAEDATPKRPLAEGRGAFSSKYSGDVLLSQGESPQVPSALAGLTSVFGMGTGVTLPLRSPETMLHRSFGPVLRAAPPRRPPALLSVL
jgi:hypothetical protein